jgi:ATP/ADP translocase
LAEPGLTKIVTLAVTVAWLFSLGQGTIQHDWTPLGVITPVMLVVVGYATGASIIRKKTNGHHNA